MTSSDTNASDIEAIARLYYPKSGYFRIFRKLSIPRSFSSWNQGKISYSFGTDSNGYPVQGFGYFRDDFAKGKHIFRYEDGIFNEKQVGAHIGEAHFQDSLAYGACFWRFRDNSSDRLSKYNFSGVYFDGDLNGPFGVISTCKQWSLQGFSTRGVLNGKIVNFAPSSMKGFSNLRMIMVYGRGHGKIEIDVGDHVVPSVEAFQIQKDLIKNDEFGEFWRHGSKWLPHTYIVSGRFDLLIPRDINELVGFHIMRL
jgi:hypothetical protein